MDKIYDPYRQEWVVDEPEERVRQALLETMIHTLGYPKSLIVIEKSLKHLPHLALTSERIPNRRLDILCYAKADKLAPLLMVECKAIPLSYATIQQVLGYNHYVKASYVAIANAQEICTLWFDTTLNEYRCLNTLPDYKKLLSSSSIT